MAAPRLSVSLTKGGARLRVYVTVLGIRLGLPAIKVGAPIKPPAKPPR